MVDIYFCHTDGNAHVSPRISLQSDGPGEIGFLDMVFVFFISIWLFADDCFHARNVLCSFSSGHRHFYETALAWPCSCCLQSRTSSSAVYVSSVLRSSSKIYKFQL